MGYGSKSITDWQDECHATAVRKGWWPDKLSPLEESARELLARIAIEHMNLSRRLEAIRSDSETPADLDTVRIVRRLGAEKVDDLAKMALIHSEVTEAVEAILANDYKQTGGGYRDPKTGETLETISKPEGAVVELADVVIRIMDWCGRKELGLESAIRAKVTYNQTRPHRHGGKLA